MNLTHREIRGIILLLLLVTAVTAITTCGGSAGRVPAPAVTESAKADTFVQDSMRLAEKVHDAGLKNRAVARDSSVSGNTKRGSGVHKKRGLNAAPVPARKSPLDEPVAR